MPMLREVQVSLLCFGASVVVPASIRVLTALLWSNEGIAFTPALDSSSVSWVFYLFFG